MTWRRFFVTLVRNSGRSLVIVVAQKLIEQPLPRRGSPLDYLLVLAEEDPQSAIGGREVLDTVTLDCTAGTRTAE